MLLVTIINEKVTLEKAKVRLLKWKDGLLEESMVGGCCSWMGNKGSKKILFSYYLVR